MVYQFRNLNDGAVGFETVRTPRTAVFEVARLL